MKPIRLKVEGPPAGLERVRNALLDVPGVMSVQLDPARREEVSIVAAETVAAEQLIEAAQQAGFIVTAVA